VSWISLLPAYSFRYGPLYFYFFSPFHISLYALKQILFICQNCERWDSI
jgi:hypothetical protein